MSNNNDTWAIAELMGHVALAGRITKPGEYGGLWQIDIPEGESFRTEFFGSQSVYRIRMVSEAIARGYARPGHEIIAYDAPIITREEHEAAMQQARERIMDLREQNEELKSQLMALPAGQSSEAIPGVADEIEELWEDPDE
jgi:hypothetical protein